MALEIGESLVGSYLRYVEGCSVVVYNVQCEDQGEIDVVGLDLNRDDDTVTVCEVATHLEGMLYGTGNDTTLVAMRNKIKRMKDFAEETFPRQ